MTHSFFEQRKKQNLRPLTISNKEKYYFDLLNIEHSWSGRMDTNIGNTFIMEAVQLLINAIELFEQGYFDCAFYSLRSAIELSTTMVFLVDMPDEERVSLLDAWKGTKSFPMQRQMLQMLSNNGYIFIDMQKKMPIFFKNTRKLSGKINKYVHKQGLEHFYIGRNHPFNASKPQDKFINTFEYYLKRCIGIVAVMRLAIDPFPILLMDEDILYRCFDSMTDPYSEKFVKEYITQHTLDAYKKTDIYKDTYNSFSDEPRKTEAVFNIVKHKYIDSTKMDEILEQLSLMTMTDIINVLMVYACDKVVKTYCHNGLLMYYTEKNTNRKNLSWSGIDFAKFAQAENKKNQQYDEAYISVFKFADEIYYAEHNEILTEDDIYNIDFLIKESLKK